ncbi:uncharacterized protein DDB_G0287625-like [Zingiber officinale]|uniref:uncharacterized protein DDB_G0287625-like n=1 Tax=Zingiber officinale TaxID=94328 RepID=UPI001C4BF821|nr:uncharacterized protein DDB_G0287625-like [Zingiber officinale]
MSVRARHGSSYFITFIDDFTHYVHVYLISHKSETLEYFRRYVNEVEKQMDKTIKALRTNRGCEYLSDQFKDLCNKKETDFHKRGEIKGNEPLSELSDSDNRLLPNESSKAQVDELLFDSSGRDPYYNDSSDPSRSNPNGNNPDHDDSYDLSRSNHDHNDSSDMSRSNPNGNNLDHDDSYDLSRSNPDHINSSNPQLRKSNRKGMPKHHYEIEGHTYIISSIDEEKPKNIDEAISCPLRDKWINAMKEEMNSMKSNNVWKLVEISHGHKAIRNK